jgi:hypothetical protein
MGGDGRQPWRSPVRASSGSQQGCSYRVSPIAGDKLAPSRAGDLGSEASDVGSEADDGLASQAATAELVQYLAGGV